MFLCFLYNGLFCYDVCDFVLGWVTVCDGLFVWVVFMWVLVVLVCCGSRLRDGLGC